MPARFGPISLTPGFLLFAAAASAQATTTTTVTRQLTFLDRITSETLAGVEAVGITASWLPLIPLILFIILALAFRQAFGLLAQRRQPESAIQNIFHRLQRVFPLCLVMAGLAVTARATGWDWLSGRWKDSLDFLTAALAFFALLWPLEALVFDLYYLETKRVRIPRLMRDVVRWSIGFVILAYVFSLSFDISITPLLTTSAVISFILGFALQDTLANLFAGLAIHFEGSFNLGDWIKAGDQEGEVAAITWRAIKIRTFEDDYTIIPNSTIAKGEIINYSQPTPLT
ncbi:mechanosensitive ion channel, partial [bacterium]|nr:mechanosensitive ion channel [bacterium]